MQKTIIDGKYKICNECKEKLPISDFAPKKPNFLYYCCRKCGVKKELEKRRVAGVKYLQQQRNWHLKNKYGIDLIQYNEILESQNHKCAICGILDTEIKDNSRNMIHKLFVDHDHKTGIVRGLLCANCNHGLGKFMDNIKYLEFAINYLNKNI